MKKTKGYKVDFAAKVITITKRFGKAAAVVGTEECNESIDVFWW